MTKLEGLAEQCRVAFLRAEEAQKACERLEDAASTARTDAKRLRSEYIVAHTNLTLFLEGKLPDDAGVTPA